LSKGSDAVLAEGEEAREIYPYRRWERIRKISAQELIRPI
jgi:hypothetical protein